MNVKEEGIKQALQKEKLSVHYKLNVLKTFLEQEVGRNDFVLQYFELAIAVVEKYQFSADVLLDKFVKINDLLDWGVNLLNENESEREDLLSQFVEANQLEKFLQDKEFFSLRIKHDQGNYLVPTSDLVSVKLNDSQNMILKTPHGELDIVELNQTVNLTHIQHLELNQRLKLETLGVFHLYEGPDFLLVDYTNLPCKEVTDDIPSIGSSETNENIVQLSEQKDNQMNAEDISSIFKSFDQAQTEGEIKKILSNINDEEIVSAILARVAIDYDKILSVFQEVGEDGLDIDTVIACLYVELKAKWIQLNIKSQYQAFSGKETDMVSMGHASVVSNFLAKIEPYLDKNYMKTIDGLLSEPIAA